MDELFEQVSPTVDTVWASLSTRSIEVRGDIDDDAAMAAISTLLYLEDKQAAAPVTLRLSSRSGELSSSLALADAMSALACPVATWCGLQGGPMATMLLAHGERGHRFAHPLARMTLARPSAVEAIHWGAALSELDRLTDAFIDLLVEDSGQSREAVEAWLDDEEPFAVAKAQARGLVDGSTSDPRTVGLARS